MSAEQSKLRAQLREVLAEKLKPDVVKRVTDKQLDYLLKEDLSSAELLADIRDDQLPTPLFTTGVRNALVRAYATSTATARVEHGLGPEQLSQLGRLVAFVDQQEKKSQTCRVSSVNTNVWNTVAATAHLQVKPFLGSMQPQRGQYRAPPSFAWDERLERAQADRYMPHLNSILPFSSRDYQLVDVANRHPHLLNTPHMADQLGYDFTGTSDVALVLRAAVSMPATGLRLLLELKKIIGSDDEYQAMVQLVLANVHSRDLKPMVVLTNLDALYKFYWLDGKTIWYYTTDAATAIGLIADYLSQEQVLADASVAATDAEEPMQPFVKRRQLSIEPGAGVSDTCMEDLADSLSIEELRNGLALSALQEFNNIPVIAAMRPSTYLSMYS